MHYTLLEYTGDNVPDVVNQLAKSLGGRDLKKRTLYRDYTRCDWSLYNILVFKYSTGKRTTSNQEYLFCRARGMSL